jgi:Secretion system C-terminal sorting domain
MFAIPNEWLYFGANSYSLASTFPWDYPTGGYIDTNKTNVTNNAPYVGRFGIQNINVTSPSWQAPSFGINLFPNPTNTNSTIQISGLYGDCIEIAIVDMLGQVVFNRKIDSVFGTLYEQIETSTWGSGIYLVSVQSNNHGLITKKLIKQ